MNLRAPSVVVAKHTGLPPLHVDLSGEIQMVKAPGSLHDRPDHFDRRSQCVQRFVDLFGMVLQTSDQSIKVHAVGRPRPTIALAPRFAVRTTPWGRGKVHQA